jgi:hypothetical protein
VFFQTTAVNPESAGPRQRRDQPTVGITNAYNLPTIEPRRSIAKSKNP